MERKIRLFAFILGAFCLSLVTAPQARADICETHPFHPAQPGTVHAYFFDTGAGWDMVAENDMQVTSIHAQAYLRSVGGSNTAHIQVKINGRVVAAWDQFLMGAYALYEHDAVVNAPMRVGDTITYFIYSDHPLQGGSVLDNDNNHVELCGPEGIIGVPGCPSCNLLLLD